MTKNITAALPDRENAAIQNCFTPKPAMKAIAITIIWRRLVKNSWRVRLSVDDHRSTAQRVNHPEVHTERFLGPMIKVPYRSQLI